MKITVFEWESVAGEDFSQSLFSPYGEVRFYGKVPQDKVVECISDSQAVFLSKVVLTAEIFDACPNLSYVGLTATGYNNVDVAAARERGITVTNIPGYSSDAVAQMTLAYLLQAATNLIAYDRSTKNGDWTRSKIFCYYPYPMQELAGKTLGLLGMGSIASRVAKAADALGMRIIYHARGKKDLPYEFVSKEKLFRESDFLSLHAPLTEETAKIVNAETLGMMKKSAWLINTARGGLVDEKSVAEALKNDKIAGFAADVLETEPQRADCPLIGVKNCILTPHVAWAPLETRKRLIGILFDNFEAFLRGEKKNVVS